MTTAQVVKTSVTVNNNSPIQDYVHPDDQTQPIVKEVSNSSRSSTVVRNNRHILIDGKSVFYQSLFDKGIMFILELEQDMKLDQLHKRDLKNSFLIYALIGTILINCHLMFSQTPNPENSSIEF